MKQKIAWTLTLILLCGLLATPIVRAQENPVVQGYLFYSATCEHCTWVRKEIIPPLYREFGLQLQLMAVEISDTNNYQWWLDAASQYGVDEIDLDVPTLILGQDVLIGGESIQAKARTLIQKYLDQGGVSYPDVPRSGGPFEPAVRFMFFWSPTCGHCTYVKENVFPTLKARYGDRLQWEAYSVEKEENYTALLELSSQAGVSPAYRGSVPAIAIGDEYSLGYSLFVGTEEIESSLPVAVDWYMGVGGADLPSWIGELWGQSPAEAPTAEPTSQAAASGVDAIHMAYFAEVGCSECDRVSIALDHLQTRFPNLVIHKLDIIDDLSTNLCLAERLNVPADKRHDAPAVFVGSDYLVDRDIQYERLAEIVSGYVEIGAEATWETCDEAAALPPPPPWWAVIVPGLIDGINPCAFATIVFFVSYLTLVERKKHEILMVGLSFTLAVFLSYLAFGMLLREILAGLVDVVGPVLRPILNLAIVLLCLVLAILSLDDYRKARRGQVKKMSLRLPDQLRRWVNTAVRKSMNARAFVLASFVAGVVVSFIELACTGQVYVPIIQGLSNPAYRAQSTMGLIVYCLAFVTPLVAVFVASYTGTNSRQLGVLLQRHTATVKLATAMLFLGVSIWLVYDVLRIWGVIAL